MYHAGTTEAGNAAEHRHAAHLFLIVQFGQQCFLQRAGFGQIDSHHNDFAHCHICLPSITPSQVAPTHSTRLPLMFAAALTQAPCSMRLKVSMENDENVVKPPITPMSMPARSTGLSLRDRKSVV